MAVTTWNIGAAARNYRINFEKRSKKKATSRKLQAKRQAASFKRAERQATSD